MNRKLNYLEQKLNTKLPFLQTLSPAQYSPPAHASLHNFLKQVFVLQLVLHVFFPVLEDSLQTGLSLVQSELDTQFTEIETKFKIFSICLDYLFLFS